jgi:anti-sigma B factor antagonist
MTAEEAPLRVGPEPDRLALSGEIDAHTAPTVREALLDGEGCGDVRVDVSEVTFIDSSGLRAVLEAHDVLHRGGGRLVLVAPSTPFLRVIDVAGVASILHVESPLDPAG